MRRNFFFAVLCGACLLARTDSAFAAPGTPEIDPSMAAAGLALASGSVLAVLERLRRR